jgi:hypothetical protein
MSDPVRMARRGSRPAENNQVVAQKVLRVLPALCQFYGKWEAARRGGGAVAGTGDPIIRPVRYRTSPDRDSHPRNCPRRPFQCQRYASGIEGTARPPPSLCCGTGNFVFVTNGA